MANITLKFNCYSGDGTHLETYLNNENAITVIVNDDTDEPKTIILDKSTAIKFAKTLRTEINKIESEGFNG